MLPMLEAWRSIRIRAAELGRQLVAGARQSQACQILMSTPGVGTITATSFITAIEDPNNFKKSPLLATSLVRRRAATNQERSIMTATYPGVAIVICEGFSTKLPR